MQDFELFVYADFSNIQKNQHPFKNFKAPEIVLQIAYFLPYCRLVGSFGVSVPFFVTSAPLVAIALSVGQIALPFRVHASPVALSLCFCPPLTTFAQIILRPSSLPAEPSFLWRACSLQLYVCPPLTTLAGIILRLPPFWRSLSPFGRPVLSSCTFVRLLQRLPELYCVCPPSGGALSPLAGLFYRYCRFPAFVLGR